MALRDLLVKFGIDVEGGKKLDDVDTKVRRTLSGMERLGKSIQRLGYWMVAGVLMRGVKSLIVGQFESAVALKYNAQALGISTEELQKYQYAATQMHVPVQQLTLSLRWFNRTVGEAATGTKASAKTFAAMGVNLKDANGNVRPTNELFTEFADKLKKVPNQALRTAYAMRTLGRGGAAMIPVLEKGGQALQDIFKDIDDLGGGFTDKFIEQAADLDVQLKRVRLGWRSMYVAVATEVIPIIRLWTQHSIRTLKVLIDFAHHTYGVRTALMALGSGATIYAITRLMRAFMPMKMTIKDLFMTLLRNAGLVIFIGLLTAAYLILDDLYTFMKGGDSVLGRFLDQIGGKGTALKFWHELKDAFNQIEKAIGPIVPKLEGIAKGVFQAFVNSVPSIVKWGGIFVTAVVDAVDWLVSGLHEVGIMTAAVFEGLKPDHSMLDEINKATAEALKVEGRYDDRHKAYQNMARTFDNIGDPGAGTGIRDGDLVSAPVGKRPGAAAAAGGPTKIEVNVTQHVNGGDPSKVRDATVSGVKKGVKDGMAQHRDAFAGVGVGMPTATGAD